jgi:RND family efflux transporter MFP subunit
MNQASNSHTQPTEGLPGAHEKAPMSPRKALAGLIVVVILFLILAAIGILRRSHDVTVLAERTDELAPPTVKVAPPKPGAPTNSFVLPGNVTAYTDAPIYARTDGYLKHWYFDIGAKVKKGALLAEIEAPELDQQLAQAEADLATAQATANNARIQADRYTGLVKSQAVSQQDTDTFVNQAAASAAAVHSSQANVQRLHELQSYEKVYAPFDGVVTARTVDTGQLINQGTTTELFHMQALNTLRVYTNVPEFYSGAVKRGMKVPLTFAEHPGKTYMGTLVTTADAIDPVSRTLLVEIEIDNSSGELFPGSLAQVHFNTPSEGETFIVSAATIMFRADGLRVGVLVNGSTAHLVPVVIGEDDGETVQIVNGLKAGDEIIQDPPDSLIEGEKLTVVNRGNNSGKGGM